MRLNSRGLAVLLISSRFLTGCTPTYGDAYLASFTAGQRAAHAGRHEESARAFDEAARTALRVKDRDEARFLQARALTHLGRWGEARTVYEKLMEQRGPRAARAEFDIAYLQIEHGDAQEGWKHLALALRGHPEHGLARRALHDLTTHAAEEGGEEARLAWLKKHAGDFTGTELEQIADYEAALSLEGLGRTGEAHDTLVTTAKRHPYPSGPLTDDALWRAALIDDQLGRYAESIAHLKELLTSREVSTGMGSYERPRYAEAQLKIAEIYRDRLKDRDAARRELHKLYAEHTTSILRDDALWAEAVLLSEDKDQEGACAAAERLTKEFADSRYARCVTEVCPTAPRNGRERACSDYIVRKLRGRNRDEDTSNDPNAP